MITLYKNKSDLKVMNKQLTKVKDIEKYELFDIDVVTPTFILTYEPSIIDSNYLYYDKNKRYYYINEISRIDGGEVIIKCSVDVLMSFKTDILNCKATIDRNENERNGYLNDSSYKAYAYSQIVAKKFPNGMNDDSIILMTIG